jgi:hypothetical protein
MHSIMNRMRQNIGPVVLLAVAFLCSSCATREAPPEIRELGPSKSDMMPKPGILYSLVMPPMLYETRQSGPKEQNSSQAWAVANEFVFRTRLRDTVVFPATGVTPAKNGHLVQFGRKDGKADLHIFVRGDLTVFLTGE